MRNLFFNFSGDRSAYGSAGFIFRANLLLLLVSYMELLPSVLNQIRRTPHSHGLREHEDRTQISFGVSVLRKWRSTFWSHSASPNDHKNDSREVDRLVIVAGSETPGEAMKVPQWESGKMRQTPSRRP